MKRTYQFGKDDEELLRLLLNSDDEEDVDNVEAFSDDSDDDYVPEAYEAEDEEEAIVAAVRQAESESLQTSKKHRTQKNVGNSSGEEPSLILKFPEQAEMLGKNNFKWKTNETLVTGKHPRRNIIHVQPGPSGNARSCSEPIDCYKLFFTDEIINKLLVHTNEEIFRKRQNYALKHKATISDVTLAELNALLGLIILAAAFKNNHLSAGLLFDSTFSGNRYVATMSRDRFNFLISCLRFDCKDTREERKSETKLAPISEIWDIFTKNCRENYKPSAYVAIDEQLVAFRGRCPFRMYIPSKPDRYGIKIIMMCLVF